MPLISPVEFEPVFDFFRSGKIGFVQLTGNVGDRLIQRATVELLQYFRINFRQIRRVEMRSGCLESDVDEFLISGGGNMGTALYNECLELRRQVVAFGKPVSVLPQTFTDDREDTSVYARVFVREQASLRINPDFILAPDLALGMRGVDIELPPRVPVGVFLRVDTERALSERYESLPDPAAVCEHPVEYIELASLFEHIYTDRLHFAIAGLMVNRRVTLLPNSYGKNRAMFETWLRDLGCEWREDLEGVEPLVERGISECWKWLSGPPSKLLPWSLIPVPPRMLAWKRTERGNSLFASDGTKLADCDDIAKAVHDVCDGHRDVETVVTAFTERYPEDRLLVAHDVQKTLAGLIECKALSEDRRGSGALIIEPRPPVQTRGWFCSSARIRRPGRQDEELWFSVPEHDSTLLSRSADPFVLALIMEAMTLGVPLCLFGGTVSRGLPGNLARFQRVWAERRSNLNIVPVYADETDVINTHPGSVVAFSGGLDSSYTLFMNRAEAADREVPDVTAAVMIHGFDIPLSEQAGYQRAYARSKLVCDAAGIRLLTLRTNFRQINTGFWEDRHGTGLAASLAALGNGFSAGVVSATMPEQIPAGWGSNPQTDPMLGSDGMAIIHYGERATRLDKFKALAQWPEALANLRVCWAGWEFGANCGTCQKCVLTQLSLRCLEAPLTCFETPLTEEELAARVPDKYPGYMDRFDLLQIREESLARGLRASWAHRLDQIYG